MRSPEGRPGRSGYLTARWAVDPRPDAIDQDRPDDNCTADPGPYHTSYRYHVFVELPSVCITPLGRALEAYSLSSTPTLPTKPSQVSLHHPPRWLITHSTSTVWSSAWSHLDGAVY